LVFGLGSLAFDFAIDSMTSDPKTQVQRPKSKTGTQEGKRRNKS